MDRSRWSRWTDLGGHDAPIRVVTMLRRTQFLEDSRSVVEYVEQRVLLTFSHEKTEACFSGYYDMGAGGPGSSFLYAGHFYRCRQCSARWLHIFDESAVAYLFLELAGSNDDDLTHLKNRLQQELGYRWISNFQGWLDSRR